MGPHYQQPPPCSLHGPRPGHTQEMAIQAGGRRPALAGPCRHPPVFSVQSLAARVLSRSAARRPSPCESPAGGRPAAASGAPPSPRRGARLESTRAAPQAALARGRLAADCAPAPKTPSQHVNEGGDRAPASGQTTISNLCPGTQASPCGTSPSWPGARSHRPVELSAGCGAEAPRSADEPAPPVGSRACHRASHTGIGIGIGIGIAKCPFLTFCVVGA